MNEWKRMGETQKEGKKKNLQISIVNNSNE